MAIPWAGARLPFAALAGIVGALVNSAAIRLTQSFGVEAGTGGLAKFALAQLRAVGLPVPANFGPVGQEAFHTGVGVLAALAYALVGYGLIPGPKVVRGVVFVQLMWLTQALVVLPWLGKGSFGLRYGPATPVWSFALNALFGIVLGLLYAPKR